MDTFGISIPGLRIAGGLIVSFIGFRMLFPQPQMESSSQAAGNDDELQRSSPEDALNIAFVPLAMPSTAGPGTIAMIISSASQIKSGVNISPWVITVAPVLTTLLVSLILWLCLRSSGSLMHLLGKSGIEAISRLMGFLLVCMGVQFTINGILESLLALVAGLGSDFLMADLGIDGEVQHESYIASWLKALKNDKHYIFKAASAASKAHSHLMDKL